MTIGLATSELTGLCCELVLYGVTTVLTLGSIYVLVIGRRADRINWVMLTCTILMFALCTGHVAVTGQRIFNSFIPGDALSRTKILASLTQPLYSAKTAIFFIMLIFGDIIVIYRCYLVWGRNLWIVIVPILLSCASAVLAFWAVWATVNPRKPGATAAIAHPAQWGTALLTLSLVANLWSVLGIAVRILSYERRFAQSQRVYGFRAFRPSFIPFASIIIESGALNAAFLVAYTVALDRTPSVLRVMADCAPTVVGVVYNLVIIRLSVNPKRDNDISKSQAGLSTIAYVRNRSKQSTAANTTIGGTTKNTFVGTGGVRSIALDMDNYDSTATDLEMSRFSERDHKDHKRTIGEV